MQKLNISISNVCKAYNNNNNNNNNNDDDDDDDDDDDGITQATFPLSGSSSTWGTNSLADGVAKEDHLNIRPHGQAGIEHGTF